MGSKSSRCHRELLRSVRERLDSIDSLDGLFEAALSLNAFLEPGVDLDLTRRELGSWVEQIREKSPSDHPRALLAHAHDVLFDKLGLRGDTEDYDSPKNSLLSSVVERRRGLPITLCLVYKFVIESLPTSEDEVPDSRLRVEGLGAPGHFMARVRAGEGFQTMIVDPFHGGRVRSDDEARKMVRAIVGDEIADRVELLPVVTHRAWLARMVRNLKSSCADRGMQECERGLAELETLLTS